MAATIRLLLFITLRNSGNAISAASDSIDVIIAITTWPTNRKVVKEVKRKWRHGVSGAHTSSLPPRTGSKISKILNAPIKLGSAEVSAFSPGGAAELGTCIVSFSSLSFYRV